RSVVNSCSRYARRVSSVDSMPIESNRFLIVPSLSSAARIPLPGATSARAVDARSLIAVLSFDVVSMESRVSHTVGGAGQPHGSGEGGVGQATLRIEEAGGGAHRTGANLHAPTRQ